MFAGLGFIGLRFFQDGSQYVGNLDYEDGFIEISGGTYTDATGLVTFSAAKSPAGVVDVNFTGNVILDLSGNVTAIAGTWSGEKVLPLSNAPPAAHAEPPIPRPPTPIQQANGAWTAFNRQNIIP
jgi:hypothetical protein